jgi:hypothetical protein
VKLLLRLGPCSPELAARLAGDDLVAKALAPKPNAAVGFLFPKWFDAGGPLLPRILEAAAGEAITFLRDAQFSAAELDAAAFLEVQCRATVAQTPADIKAMQAAYAADTLHASPCGWQVRLPRQVYLTRPVPADKIAHVDQWTGEHVAGTGAAQALRASGLKGWLLDPVRLPGKAGTNACAEHLVANELLPAALGGVAGFWLPETGPRAQGTPKRYGCIAYAKEALRDAQDFSRTAEPWGAWQVPGWVVSQRARRWFVDAALKGWAFQPILQEGTALHAEHARRWTALLDALKAHPGSQVMA